MRFPSILTMVLLLGVVGFDQAGAAPVQQYTPHSSSMTTDIAITWRVLTNHVEGGRFRSRLTLANRGDEPLPSAGWTLYFNFLRPIDAESLPPSVRITRINGDFYKLEPAEHFAPIRPDERRAVEFEAGAWAIKEVDAPVGFYIVFDEVDGQPGAPVLLTDVTVAPFTRPRQTHRSPDDAVPVPTPASRYAQNEALQTLSADAIGRIVPTPVSMEAGIGTFTLDRTTTIRRPEQLATEASLLAEALALLLGVRPPTDADRDAAAITLREGAVTVGGRTLQPGGEAYRLTVDTTGIEVVGTDAAGVFYGLQSLRAWLPVDVYRQEPPSTISVPAVTLADAPRFPYRGLHLDVARNFQPKGAVKRLLDVMAFYKLNTFHFHLTDDEGWRLAIDGLPELTEVGGRRGHTMDEHDHLVPSYGSGPDPAPAASHGSGWYTRNDFVEILRYARERHIEVVPEIDVPGHARAAIVAMKARYDRLMDEGRTEAAGRHLLHDPADRSEYRSVQGWDDNVLNVCQPPTYRFLEAVIDDIQAMYEEAEAPLTTIHVGGDEVPHGAWTASPACDAFIAESDSVEEVDDLFDHFVARMRALIAERGLTMAGWEEVALEERTQGAHGAKAPRSAFAGQGVRPYVWANIWGSGTEDHAYQLANAGYEVVMSHASNLYFDMAYDKHPEEAGYYWASFIDDAGPFEFVPLDLYKGAKTDQMGHPIPPDAFDEAVRLTPAGRNNILGLQGQLWGETLRSVDRMEYMAVPRLISLAERAWAPQPGWATIDAPGPRARERLQAWNEFAHRLGRRELPRLDALDAGWSYRLPVPGGVVEDGRLRANVALPGLTIRYTTDGSTPTAHSPRYTGPVSVAAADVVKLRTFDTRGRGGRTATISMAR